MATTAAREAFEAREALLFTAAQVVGSPDLDPEERALLIKAVYLKTLGHIVYALLDSPLYRKVSA